MIVLDGENYETLAGAALRFGVHKKTLRSWLLRHNYKFRKEPGMRDALILVSDVEAYRTVVAPGRPRKTKPTPAADNLGTPNKPTQTGEAGAEKGEE